MRVAREEQVLAAAGARVRLTASTESHRVASRRVLPGEAKQVTKPSEHLHRDPFATSPRHERVVELEHDFRQADVDARVSSTLDPGSAQGPARALYEILESASQAGGSCERERLW